MFKNKLEQEAEEKKQKEEAESIVDAFQKRLQRIKLERMNKISPQVETSPEEHHEPEQIEVEAKTVETKTVAPRAVESRSVESRTVSAKAVEAKTVEAKTVDAKVVDSAMDMDPPIADQAELKTHKASLANRVNSAMNLHIENGMLNDFISLLIEDLSQITKKTLNK